MQVGHNHPLYSNPTSYLLVTSFFPIKNKKENYVVYFILPLEITTR